MPTKRQFSIFASLLVLMSGGLAFATHVEPVNYTKLPPMQASHHIQERPRPVPPGWVLVNESLWELNGISPDTMRDLVGPFEAYTVCTTHHIYYRTGLSLSLEREAILHEFLHAEVCHDDGKVYNLTYNSKTQTKHEGFYVITETVLKLMEDNPNLAEYLFEDKK